MRSKVMMLATAAVALVVAPVFAQESAMNLREGEAMMVTPNGTMHKATKMIDDARHEAALKASRRLRAARSSICTGENSTARLAAVRTSAVGRRDIPEQRASAETAQFSGNLGARYAVHSPSRCRS